jgi:AraC-like DNA-binding protein
LHDGDGTVSLNVGPEYSALSFALHLPGVSAVEVISDLSVAIMYQTMRMLCCAEWSASTISLVRQEPRDIGRYRRFFRAPLFFNSTKSAITFSNECLRQAIPSADSLMYRYLENKARNLHELQHHEIVEEMPEVVTRGLLTNRFAASQIADTFGIRERTLHRRLNAGGTSFRKELDQARYSVSKQLLGTTSLPVCDIASSLGYADSSGFIRAFQRWSGSSPSAWRKQNSTRSQANG